ncbi:MAG TPA: hypothetical protein VFN10_18325 [Thermoanaerobaculia bacterium]|nr:hypothetical protein [Thermoanaerobaculia bacterium]
MATLALDLNPKFTFHSPVFAEGLVDVPEHVDHAIIALDGRAPLAGDACVETINPVIGPTTLRIDLWVEDLDDTTCTYAFTCTSEDGRIAYARGERCVVNIDPKSQKRTPWPVAFRASHADLRKDLPAFG